MKSTDTLLAEAEKNAVTRMLCNADVFSQWLYEHCCGSQPHNPDVMQYGKHNEYTKALAMLLISEYPTEAYKYREYLLQKYIEEFKEWKEELLELEYQSLLEIDRDKLQNPDF